MPRHYRNGNARSSGRKVSLDIGGRRVSVNEDALMQLAKNGSGQEVLAQEEGRGSLVRARAISAGSTQVTGQHTINFDLTGHATEVDNGAVFFDGNQIIQQQITFTEVPALGSNSFQGVTALTNFRNILERISGNTPHVLRGIRLITADKSVFTGEVKIYWAKLNGSVTTQLLNNQNTLNPSSEQAHIYDWGRVEGGYAGTDPLDIVVNGLFAVSIKVPITKTIQIGFTMGAQEETFWGS